jgi:hypothetical protein
MSIKISDILSQYDNDLDLPLSGGTLTGNLTIKGMVSATGGIFGDGSGLTGVSGGSASTTTTAAITAKGATIGAYSNNTVIPENTSLETIIRNMLTTVIPATYSQPNLAFNPSPATLSYEIGTNVSVTFNIAYTQNDAGPATSFTVSSNSVLLSSGSTLSQFLTSFQLNNNTTFTAQATYTQGPQKFDNIGNSSGTPIAAGTLTRNTSYTTFRNNFYTSDTNSTAATTSSEVRTFENSTTARSFNISIAGGDRRVSFAFPSNLSNINVQVIQVGVGNITSGFTQTSVSVAGANQVSPINYLVYTLLVPSGYPQGETYQVSF